MDRQTLKIVETGRALELLLTSEGWKVVQDMMKSYEDEAVQDIVRYRGSDGNVIKSLQMFARAMRETRNSLNVQIEDAVEAYRTVLKGDFNE
jgi:hypothetical protein